MYICNITIKITNSIADEWLRWQQQEHIPEVMNTGLFLDYKFFRLLEQDDSEGPTFIVQYFTDDLLNYNRYLKEYAPSHREKAFARWGNQFIAFRTLMKSVH